MHTFFYGNKNKHDDIKEEKYIVVDEHTELIKFFYLKTKVLNELKDYIDNKGETYIKHIVGTCIYEDKGVKLITVGLFGDVYEHLVRSHYDEYLGLLLNI